MEERVGNRARGQRHSRGCAARCIARAVEVPASYGDRHQRRWWCWRNGAIGRAARKASRMGLTGGTRTLRFLSSGVIMRTQLGSDGGGEAADSFLLPHDEHAAPAAAGSVAPHDSHCIAVTCPCSQSFSSLDADQPYPAFLLYSWYQPSRG